MTIPPDNRLEAIWKHRWLTPIILIVPALGFTILLIWPTYPGITAVLVAIVALVPAVREMDFKWKAATIAIALLGVAAEVRAISKEHHQQYIDEKALKDKTDANLAEIKNAEEIITGGNAYPVLMPVANRNPKVISTFLWNMGVRSMTGVSMLVKKKSEFQRDMIVLQNTIPVPDIAGSLFRRDFYKIITPSVGNSDYYQFEIDAQSGSFIEELVVRNDKIAGLHFSLRVSRRGFISTPTYEGLCWTELYKMAVFYPLIFDESKPYGDNPNSAILDTTRDYCDLAKKGGVKNKAAPIWLGPS